MRSASPNRRLGRLMVWMPASRALLLICCLAGSPVSALGQSAQVRHYGTIAIQETASGVEADNGLVQISLVTSNGSATYAWKGVTKIRDASIGVRLGSIVKSTSYTDHTFSASDITPLSDGFGSGIQFSFRHTVKGRPTLRQNYYLYEGKPYFFVEAVVESGAAVSTNWLAPIMVDTPGGVDIGSHTDPRVLFVPWDNDYWVRYRADPIDGTGTSYEATAIYDNSNRHGLVLGSVTHDTWKTGIDHEGSPDGLQSLEVYGGASSEFTRDILPHGQVSGTRIVSPRIFVGYYDDWRKGMEDFGAANRVISPPLPWNGEMPIGWNSWASYGCNINPRIMEKVSGFIKNNLQDKGFNNHGAVYVVWDSACPNTPLGYGEEYAAVARQIKANGQHPGIYFSTHGTWRWTRDPHTPVPGANGKYTWNDLYLRDDQHNIIVIHGWRALDPTHPGTKAYIEYVLNNFKRWGYEYVKMDFLTHLAVEGRHYIEDMTAMQAYNYGMKYIRDTIGGSMFVSLSIAPLFPGAEYGHARRISCDVFGTIKDTEYMLNSVTYGWWLGKYYRYNDGDHIVTGPGRDRAREPASYNEARTRVTSAAISGLFIDSDALAGNVIAQERAKELLTRAGILALVRKGRTFRPVAGNTGNRAASVFELEDGTAYYLAVFNYDPVKVARTIGLARAGLSGTITYKVTDLWSGATSMATGSLVVPLQGSQATILRLAPDTERTTRSH